MASIGHELRHAIEFLSEPNVRDYRAAFSFFDRKGPTDAAKAGSKRRQPCERASKSARKRVPPLATLRRQSPACGPATVPSSR